MRCERNGVERAYTRKIWKMPLPFRNFSSASPYSIFYRFSEKIENGFAPQHKIVRCSTVLLGQGRFPVLPKGTLIFHFSREICIFVRFFRKQEICCAPIGQRYFPFWLYKIQPQKGALSCASKSKRSVAQKSNWKNARASAVCMTKYNLPSRGCSTPTHPLSK